MRVVVAALLFSASASAFRGPLYPLGIRAPGRVSPVGLRLRMAVKTDSARSAGLALAFDDGTRKSHSVAENTAFVTGFFKGISNEASFVQLVTSLWFVYDAMEGAFDEAQDSTVRAMDFRALRRKQSLEQDMEFFYSNEPEWRTKVKPSAATKAYVEHIRKVANSEKTWLLVAHMYTRYLGDLFGGQMMMGMATKSLQLPEDKGVRFYRFEEIADNKAFIEDWYSTVNAQPFSESEKAALVEEANLVFRYNIAIFEELEGNSLKAMFSLALAALRDKFRA